MRVVFSFALAPFVVMVTGCGADSKSAKRSHFEHDHEVADHWPSDLADVAVKIRENLELVQANDPEVAHLSEEIVDLVGWAPEIAADTDLSESDWLPIYHATDSLSARLEAVGSENAQTCREQTLNFCELIDASVAKIPTQQASTEDDSQ